MGKWTLQEFLERADSYLTNELSAEERAEFDQFRRENPLFEEKFLQHQELISAVNQYQRRAEFKQSLDDVFEQE